MSIFSKLFGFQSSDGQKQNKFQEIEREFDGNQKMVALAKASWLTSRGNYLGDLGKLDQAIVDFKEAIKLNPNHYPAKLALGLSYGKKGLLKEALATLKSIPNKPKKVDKKHGGYEFDLFNIMTGVYGQMGDKSKTIEYAKKAIEAAKDPERKKQRDFLLSTGELSGLDSADSQAVESLKGIIQELEEKQIYNS